MSSYFLRKLPKFGAFLTINESMDAMLRFLGHVWVTGSRKWVRSPARAHCIQADEAGRKRLWKNAAVMFWIWMRSKLELCRYVVVTLGECFFQQIRTRCFVKHCLLMDRRRMLSLVFQFQERRTCCNQLMAGNTHRCTMAKSLGNLRLKLFFVMALSRGIILDLQVRSCLQTTLPLCQQFFCFGHVPNCEAHVTGIVYFEGGRRQCCPMRKMPRR